MSEAVDRALSENNALISSIIHHNAAGRHFAAVQLLEKVQNNLQFIAAVADHGIPIQPTPLPLPSNINLNPAQGNQPQHIDQTLSQTPHPQPSHPPSLPQVQLSHHQPPITTTTTGTTNTITNINNNNNNNFANPNVLLGPSNPNCTNTTTAIAPHPVSIIPSQSSNEQQHGQLATSFWTSEELARYEEAMKTYGNSGHNGQPDFKAISMHVRSRSAAQVRHHYNSVSGGSKSDVEMRGHSKNNENSNREEGNDGHGRSTNNNDNSNEKANRHQQQHGQQPHDVESTHHVGSLQHGMPPTGATATTTVTANEDTTIAPSQQQAQSQQQEHN